MIVSMATYTFLGLRLLNALAVNVIFLAAFETVAFTTPGTFSSHNGLMTFINSNFFLSAINLIGIAVGYFLELYHRKDFMQRKMIEVEKNRTQVYLLQRLIMRGSSP
jgi:hypothetical protein